MLKKFYKNFTRKRKYNNVIEAVSHHQYMRVLSGAAVITVRYRNGRLDTDFSMLGLVMFITYVHICWYCWFVTYSEDQSILRILLKTKLKHYGDMFERVTTFIYFNYGMWKLAFRVTCSLETFKIFVDIDKTIKRLGVCIDYNNLSLSILYASIGLNLFIIIRIATTVLILSDIGNSIPIEPLIQDMLNDTLALLFMMHFCVTALVKKERFALLNKVLAQIPKRTTKKGDGNVSHNAVTLDNKGTCDKIRLCAKIFIMLHKSCEIGNDLFGYPILLAMVFNLSYVILNLFYFMEGTAAGLYNDSVRYIYFIILVFWKIFSSIVACYPIIYFSQTVVKEAKFTTFITHQILIDNADATVTEEASRLNLQLKHVFPKFTACRMMTLDNSLVLEGVRTVTTFMIVLLQFVVK